jgi:[acyl-carrier-protein] S-malonyltransferase
MTKTALFFPGQASQYVGMGKDLHETSPEVRALYELASEDLGVDIARLSFEGPAEELKRTRFTQPAILLHSLAVLTVLGTEGLEYDYACGHSLGEYAALAVAGALTFENAVKAVVRRSTLMEAACQENPGTMAAIIGLNESQVEDICRRASSAGVVVAANFNSATQIAISGSMAAVEEAVKLAREAGAKRALMLEVGGAFHSPLMAPAKNGMQEYLDSIEINDPTHPVVANVTGRPASDAAEIKQLLVEQITAPVRWSQTMKCLVDHGVTGIMEIGPGKVLAGLAKRDMKPQTTIVLDTLSDVKSYSAIIA